MNEEHFELTASQKVLEVKMRAFLDGPERVFLLTGKPGVGKTTMNKIMLRQHIKADKNVAPSSTNINVAGITLAHRAKKILGQHIPRVFTFAKAYGMKEEIDEETGERKFVINQFQKEKVCIGDMSIPVFVHDEVSQYTQAMLDIVYERTSMFSKIIFMGDRAQLPPIESKKRKNYVEDADSPIFYYNIPESCKHELTERVRQAEGNPILDLTDTMREEIFGSRNVKKVLGLISKPIMSDGLGWDYMGYSKIYEHIQDKKHFDTALIAFRNKTVNFFNDKIRNHLLKDPPEKLVDGDLVCMTDNFYREDANGLPLYVFHNSDVFKLYDVYSTVHKFQFGKHTYRIDVYVSKVEGKHSKEVFITPTENGMVMYLDALEEIADLCREGELKWYQFWKFKDQFCKYTYGYCITAYKAQGSTYETVYVDINDILLTGPLTPKRQLQTIYTIVTRASKNVYFLKGE